MASDVRGLTSAGLVTCPGEIVARASCRNDTSWHANNDWTVRLRAHLQYGALAYSRSNGTIIWHALDASTPPAPANVSAAEVLRAYDTLLFDTTTLNRTAGTAEPLPLFSSSVFPTFLWITQPMFSGRSAANPAAAGTAYGVLQSLLAMPLILCQDGFVRRILPVAVDSREVAVTPAMVAGMSGLDRVLSPLPPRRSPAAFAYHRWEAAASTPTLAAYLALSGAALLCCAAVQVLAARAAAAAPRLSRFPAVDLLTHCAVEDDRRRVVYRAAAAGVRGAGAREGELRWLSGLNVRRSRPRDSDDGGGFFDSAYRDATAVAMGEMSPMDRRGSSTPFAPSPSPSAAEIGLAISTDHIWSRPEGRAGSWDSPRALC